jgi:anti-sigma-K factor RsiG
VEPFPDLASLSDADLKRHIDELTKEEQEVSYRRRILHGRIDLLRAELQARLREKPESILDEVDVDHLAAILAGKAAPPAEG